MIRLLEFVKMSILFDDATFISGNVVELFKQGIYEDTYSWVIKKEQRV